MGCRGAPAASRSISSCHHASLICATPASVAGSIKACHSASSARIPSSAGRISGGAKTQAQKRAVPGAMARRRYVSSRDFWLIVQGIEFRAVRCARNSRELIDGLQRLQLAIAAQTQGLEAPTRRPYLLLEGAHRFVEGFDAAAERLAEPSQVLSEYRQALVQLLAQLADLGGVIGQPRLLPAVFHDPEQRDQAGRCRQHHLLAQGIVDQGGIF